MNADSCGPSRSLETPDSSSFAYCRRLPYRSCQGLDDRGKHQRSEACHDALPFLEMGLTRQLLFLKELFDPAGDLFSVRLQREVTRVEQVRLHVLQVSRVGCGALRREYEVVLTPHDQRWRLILAQDSLKLRIEWYIR